MPIFYGMLETVLCTGDTKRHMTQYSLLKTWQFVGENRKVNKIISQLELSLKLIGAKDKWRRIAKTHF